MKKNWLICLVGPTAIGKTKLAITLAKYFKSDIISADSRQFYQEMNIGTAVPSVEELKAVTHHFIQNKSIHQNYTVGDFETECLCLLDELFKKNNIQILVGGSGLYVNVVIKGFDEFPDIDAEIRQQVNSDYQTHGLSFLVDELKHKDAKYFEYLLDNNPQTLQNPQRIKRFVEVCRGSLKPYSSFLNQEKTPRNFSVIQIGLEAERAVIYDRINQRVNLMMEEGLLNEVELLRAHKNINALKTVGYQELFDFFDQKVSLANAIENIKQNTRNFAKRQLTWFKRDQNTQWFNYQTNVSNIIKHIEEKIN